MSCPEQVFTFSTDHYEHLCIKRPTHLTSPLFIEVPVPNQIRWLSCICVFGVSILTISTILRLHLGIVPTV